MGASAAAGDRSGSAGRRVAPLVAALAVAIAPAAAGATGTPRPEIVNCRDGRLTVRLERVPVDDVVDLFARTTGATIRGEPTDVREVTKRFDCVPLPEAFGRLLGAQNFVMRYGDGGRLSAVDLLGAPQPLPQPGRARPVRAITYRLFAAHAPVPLERELAAAVGAPTGRLRQLLDVAIDNADAAVRRRAVRKLVDVFDHDQGLHDAGLAALRGTGDEMLIDLVDRNGPERAAGFFTDVVSEATDGYVRARASRLLRAVRHRAPMMSVEIPKPIGTSAMPGT